VIGDLVVSEKFISNSIQRSGPPNETIQNNSYAGDSVFFLVMIMPARGSYRVHVVSVAFNAGGRLPPLQ